VTKQAIGTLVGELEARSYVRREPDPADRRAWVIAYTEAGRDFLQDAHEVKQEIEGEYAKVLGAAGLRELRVLLGKLVGRSPAG
jgi:DNA-binding MarR family transcriptional regulator